MAAAASPATAVPPAVSASSPPAVSSSSSSAGLTRDLVNNYRFQVAVTVKGQSVFVEVFHWTYQGGPSVPIRQYFFNILNFNERRYRGVLNTQQRNLIDSGADSRRFDISLLYVLLQNVCGLATPNDPVWISGGQALEHLLYKVKSFRNNIAHTSEIQPMTDQELESKLSDLENVLTNILQTAGTRTGLDSAVIDTFVTENQQYFKELQMKLREPLDLTDTTQIPVLQNELAIFLDELKSSVQRDCENELCTSYPDEFNIELVHWLIPDVRVNPSLMFTKMVIGEDVTLSRPSLNLEPRELPYEELLQAQGRDGHVPEVLIVSGEGGVGKSTFLKYLVEKWVQEVQARQAGNDGQVTEVQGLHLISPLLFFQLRETTCSSWEDVLTRRLSNTLAESNLLIKDFGQLIKRMKPVIFLDGFDEAQKTSVGLVRELFDIPDIRVVVTTRPGCLDTLTKMVPARRKKMNVKILGIREEDRLPFIEKTLGVLVPDESRKAEALKKLEAKLGNMDFDSEFNIPLNLELLIILEVESPDSVTCDTSTSTVYQEIIKMILGKVEDRRTLQDISDRQYKISEYVHHHEKVALQTLIRNEHDLTGRTVLELENKCRELQLPPSEILSGFFTLKRTWQGLSLVRIWSYPHGRFQEQWAANYVVRCLLSLSASGLLDESMESPYENPITKIMKQVVETLPEGLLNNNRIPNFLAAITGLLAQSHGHLLEKVAFSIVTLVKVDTIDNILLQIMESKENPEVFDNAFLTLAGSSIWSCSGKHLQALPAVLVHAFPNELRLSVSSPKRCPLRVLEAVSERNINVTLESKVARPTDYWDHHLEVLTRSTSQCSLISAACRLSAEGVMHLPRDMKHLYIITDVDGIHGLATKLPTLQELTTLVLSIENALSSPPNLFPILPLQGPLPEVHLQGLPLSPLSGAEVDSWCDLAARLCSRDYYAIGSVLSSEADIKKLLEGFHHRNVRATYMSILILKTLADEVKSEAKEFAMSLGVCEYMFFMTL